MFRLHGIREHAPLASYSSPCSRSHFSYPSCDSTRLSVPSSGVSTPWLTMRLARRPPASCSLAPGPGAFLAAPGRLSAASAGRYGLVYSFWRCLETVRTCRQCPHDPAGLGSSESSGKVPFSICLLSYHPLKTAYLSKEVASACGRPKQVFLTPRKFSLRSCQWIFSCVIVDKQID